MAAIFVLSGIRDVGPLPGGVSDVAAHFAGYGLLGALLLRAVAAARWSGVTPSAAGRAWLISAIYGMTDEFHQSFVGGRTPSAADWLADAAGAAVAVAAIVLIAARVRRETAVASAKAERPGSIIAGYGVGTPARRSRRRRLDHHDQPPEGPERAERPDARRAGPGRRRRRE
jgi:hypothetical protein